MCRTNEIRVPLNRVHGLQEIIDQRIKQLWWERRGDRTDKIIQASPPAAIYAAYQRAQTLLLGHIVRVCRTKTILIRQPVDDRVPVRSRVGSIVQHWHFPWPDTRIAETASVEAHFEWAHNCAAALLQGLSFRVVCTRMR